MLPVTDDNENRTDEHGGGGGSGDRYYGDEKMHLQTNKEANKKKESEEEGTRTMASQHVPLVSLYRRSGNKSDNNINCDSNLQNVRATFNILAMRMQYSYMRVSDDSRAGTVS